MNLKERARDLRKNPTEAEKKVWSKLRNRQLENYRFYRQFVIGCYIVDFICRERNLIIEIDGGQHCESKEDYIRTAFLEDKGYKVIRFWNNEVIKNMDGVLNKISEDLKTLTPTLSLKEEGER